MAERQWTGSIKELKRWMREKGTVVCLRVGCEGVCIKVAKDQIRWALDLQAEKGDEFRDYNGDPIDWAVMREGDLLVFDSSVVISGV